MTNAGLKAMMNEYKDNLCFLMLDNSDYILFGYDGRSRYNWESAVIHLPESEREEALKKLKKRDILTPDRLEFKSYDGVDFFGVPITCAVGSTLVEGVYWHRTDCVQGFGIVGPDFTDWRLDPVLFVR